MTFDANQQYRILVVDDDAILNSLFCAFLGSRDFETISAESVEQAKKILIEDDNIDLMLLDYQLGDGVGLDLLEADYVIRYRSLPPVIMISANEDPEFLEKCFIFGVADYIIKPVNLSLLALKVKALVNSVRLQRIVSQQNSELEKFKVEAEREEAVAKFTYEYLVSQNSQKIKGVTQYLRPCSSFSGDIAIARVSPGGDVYFILADATGHGLSAAITIMPVVTIFNSMVAKGFHLQQIVTEINRKLVNDTPDDRFVAAIVVECNVTQKEIYVWNGSMPNAYWVDRGKILETFPSTQMALGILSTEDFDANVMTFPMPDTGYLYLYTDGLIEQQNPEGEQFGSARLKNLLCDVTIDPVKDVLSALEGFAQGVPFSDDVSLCALDLDVIFHEHEFLTKANNFLAEQIDPFRWTIKISGKKLAHADLPSMTNNFLQYIGLDQKTCQRVFAVISEMVSNGLDHGILKLSSDIKQNPEGFMEYFLKREELLKTLGENDSIELSLEWSEIEGAKKLIISCRDSGLGYDYSQERSIDNQRYSGRGVSLIRSLTDKVEIFAPGNFIKAIL
jgi:two-component system, HptB-dependent secretion and biofilm response regulator